MKVRALNLLDLDISAILTYDILRHPENRTPFMPNSYEEIRNHYEKLINHPHDQVVGCFRHNKLVGVLAFVTDLNHKQLTTVGGVFTKLSYKAVSNAFNRYFKEHFASFSVIVNAYEENKYLRYYMDYLKVKPFEIVNEYTFKASDNLFHSPVKLIDESCYEEFIKLSSESKLKYNGRKMLEYKDNFHIYVRDELHELVGYCSMKVNNNIKRIIEVKLNDKHLNNGLEEKILDASIIKEGIDNTYLMALDFDNPLNKVMSKYEVIENKKVFTYRIDY